MAITLGGVDLPYPLYGYQSTIDMAVDARHADDGVYHFYDHGSAYDTRSCDVTFEGTQSEIDAIIDKLLSTSRGSSLALVLPASSKFYPFGPDRGDAGTFTVVSSIIETGKVVEEPKNYHRIRIRFQNVGAWPTYSLPATQTDMVNGITIGDESGIRFPVDFFDPEDEYAIHVDVGHGGTNAFWVDRSSRADDVHKATFTLKCRHPKAAHIINYIVATARTAGMAIDAKENSWPFGTRITETGAEYTVQLIDYRIVVTHSMFNEFTFTLVVTPTEIT